MHTSTLTIDFTPFDYANPPEPGTYWVILRRQIMDGDVDDYGRTVAWPTGEVEQIVSLVEIEVYDDDEVAIHPLQFEMNSHDEADVILYYAPFTLPRPPEELVQDNRH